MIRYLIRLVLAASALLWLPGGASAQTQGWREASIAVQGVQRWYRVHVPEGLPPHAPLLLSLHGGTGSMYTIDTGATQGWVKLADQHRFVLLVPNGSNDQTGDTHGRRQNWNDVRDPGEGQSSADDVSFLRALLNRVEQEYGTDPDRVYVTGNSNGGLMAYRLLVDMPERFAAAASFIANLPVQSAVLHAPSRAVPLLLWHGTQDGLMKFNGGEIPGLRGQMRSMRDTVDWWVQAQRADAAQARTDMLPDVDPDDGCRVQRTLYPALPGGAPLLHYLALGGGHAMPSQGDYPSEGGPFYRRLVGRVCKDVDGPQLAWAFMSVYTARRHQTSPP